MRHEMTGPEFRAHCCPGCSPGAHHRAGVTRRRFLSATGLTALGGGLLTGLSWPSLAAAPPAAAPPRRPLRVLPLLTYDTPLRRPQSSWRHWGGVQTEDAAQEEVQRIRRELQQIRAAADFPVEFAPVACARNKGELPSAAEFSKVDACIVYAAGGWMDALRAINDLKKDMIIFCRHKSGPVYLWYEIISPRFLRQHTDELALRGVDDGDVVIDSQEELLWRLRAFCGLRNTLGTKILAIGGPGAWAQPPGVVPDLVRKIWKFDLQTVPYADLGELIQAARRDEVTVDRSKERAHAYLAQPGSTLETKQEFVENAFLLDDVFRSLMQEAGCSAITINGCMGTIMPLAETSACLTLMLLNDDGYLAFCESDFVVIPSGVLLSRISGKPVFLNDPTYPHDGVITIAHCTAPRRMTGKELEPARILTHFESDYGAAPKVEMGKGQVVTNIAPDFASKRWVGLLGEIIDAPFMDICRSQIDIKFTCDSQLLAERMPGFHWMTGYGDYRKELGYALKRVGIAWECLG